MTAVLATISLLFHLFKMAISKKYRDKEKAKREARKLNKIKIKRINEVKNSSEFHDAIYDSYLNDFDILNFEKYKTELNDFSNENNIVNIIYNSFSASNLRDLQYAIEKIKKENIENESVLVYLKVIKDIDNEKDEINIYLDDFENKFRKIIQTKLLEIRKERLNKTIGSSKSKITEKLISFKNQNSINEVTFSLDHMIDKIGNKVGYNSFIENFYTEFDDIEINIKDIVKYEIVEEYIYNVKEEIGF